MLVDEVSTGAAVESAVPMDGKAEESEVEAEVAAAVDSGALALMAGE